jgi:hypothetical protein
MSRHRWKLLLAGLVVLVGVGVLPTGSVDDAEPGTDAPGERPNQVLDWNQIFVDTLIATNTANSSSQRLGAIVHAAVFDAYNGIERRYTPVFVHQPRKAPRAGPP